MPKPNLWHVGQRTFVSGRLRTKPHYDMAKLDRILCVAYDREAGVIPETHTKLDLSHRAMTLCPHPTMLDIKGTGVSFSSPTSPSPSLSSYQPPSNYPLSQTMSTNNTQQHFKWFQPASGMRKATAGANALSWRGAFPHFLRHREQEGHHIISGIEAISSPELGRKWAVLPRLDLMQMSGVGYLKANLHRSTRGIQD